MKIEVVRNGIIVKEREGKTVFPFDQKGSDDFVSFMDNFFCSHIPNEECYENGNMNEDHNCKKSDTCEEKEREEPAVILAKSVYNSLIKLKCQ